MHGNMGAGIENFPNLNFITENEKHRTARDWRADVLATARSHSGTSTSTSARTHTHTPTKYIAYLFVSCTLNSTAINYLQQLQSATFATFQIFYS